MKVPACLLASVLMLGLATAQELPNDLARLKEQREKQIAKIDEIYVQQLQKLKTKYMRAGDLDSANLVDGMIKEFDVIPPKEPNPTPETTPEGKWEWGSGGVLELTRGGVATHTAWGKHKGSWEQDSQGVVKLKGGNGLLFSIEIDGEKGSATCHESRKATSLKKIR